ncbi:MAG: hypothetical protein MR867_07565, partial [Eubacterium sp.]|nr:hypothetical protein [Eubacterium sp.]
MAVCALAVMLCAGMTTACTNTKKAPEATTQEETATSSVNFGKGLNEDGTLEGVNATDYVTLCDYSAINISKEDVTASKDEVQSQIDSLMENYKKTEQVKD